MNAALIRPGRKPGEYPSAGPLPQVFDVWRAGAPILDFLAPDIYFPNFVEWARAYDIPDNPFFVPETGRQPEEYLMAGRGLTVTFSADEGLVGIESIREGVYEDGQWSPGRLLNGDQSHQGRHLRLPPDAYGVQRVRLYRYS